MTGFSDAFADDDSGVACDTVIESKTTLAALVAAQTGTMTNKSDGDTGMITLSTGHGITTGMICDVYFPAGVHYGGEATVSSNEVTIEGGTGVDLPANAVACTIVEQTAININFDGDDMRIIAVVYRNTEDTGAFAHTDFQDTSDNSIVAHTLKHETISGGLVRGTNLLNITGGDTNTFTGARITHCAASHDSTSAAYLYVYLGYNA